MALRRCAVTRERTQVLPGLSVAWSANWLWPGPPIAEPPVDRPQSRAGPLFFLLPFPCRLLLTTKKPALPALFPDGARVRPLSLPLAVFRGGPRASLLRADARRTHGGVPGQPEIARLVPSFLTARGGTPVDIRQVTAKSRTTAAPGGTGAGPKWVAVTQRTVRNVLRVHKCLLTPSVMVMETGAGCGAGCGAGTRI